MGTLETVKDSLEKRDEEVLNRQKVFAVNEEQEGQIVKAEPGESAADL